MRSPSTTAPRAAPRTGWPQHGGARGGDAGRRRPTAPRSSSPASATTTTCARVTDRTRTAPSRRSRPAPVFVDHTTASAAVARELAAAAAARGAGFVDAPVSGGQAGAENGALTVMCGGEPRALRPGRAGDRRLCPGLPADGAGRRRAAHQDGQPDLHRRPAAGPLRGPRLRAEGRARRRGGARRDRQGRRRLVADGEPRPDDARRPVRLRLRRRLDAQGPRASASPRPTRTAPRCRRRR